MSDSINKKDIHKHEQTRAIVSNNVKNYADEPFFTEKASKARVILDGLVYPVRRKNSLRNKPTSGADAVSPEPKFSLN